MSDLAPLAQLLNATLDPKTNKQGEQRIGSFLKFFDPH